MAQHYRFFGSADGDPREYSQTQFAEVLERILRNGYFKGVGTELQVVASTPNAMSVDVGIGQAWINGYWYGNDAVITLPISTANTVNPRIDRIVLRLDVVTNRTIELAVLQGTPAASPVAPSLTRDGQIHEIALADVLVGANVSSILTANITDQRNNDSLCGFAVSRDTIESGSNANGTWIKYPDGTLVCHGRIINGNGITEAEGVFYKGEIVTIPYPKPFFGDTPSIDISLERNDRIGLVKRISNGTTNMQIQAYIYSAPISSGFPYYLNYVAMGRWK